MDAALQALCTQTVTIAHLVSVDGYGVVTYGAPTTVAAYVSMRPRRYVSATGDEKVSRAIVVVDGSVPVLLTDRVTLPDGTAPALQVVERAPDLDGTAHHYRLTF